MNDTMSPYTVFLLCIFFPHGEAVGTNRAKDSAVLTTRQPRAAAAFRRARARVCAN